MLKKLILLFIVPVLFLISFSCQKELDNGSSGLSGGYLVKDANGDCNGATVAGNYKTGKALNDSNRLEVTVNVTKTGTYTIHTDTVNGYSFKATGRFANAGVQLVRLAGAGKPLTAGINHFTIYYDSSICQIAVIVQAPAAPAAFTLAGAPNGCTNATLYGSFAMGATLDTSSGITITINVTTPGSYSITTNTVNGYNFSGTGILTATGIQTVRLPASGTPATSGTNTFTVSAAGAMCTFPVTVLMPVAVNTADYFPLTTGSYWVYNDLYNTGDSLKRIITDSVIRNGDLFKKMEQQRTFNTQQYLFRRNADNYYEFGSVSKYTTSFSYGTVMEDTLLFLKVNVPTGTSWRSPDFVGAASFGQTIYLRYNYICEDADATESIGSNVFIHVRKVLMYPEIRSEFGQWGITNEVYRMHYAKGVGLIYLKSTNQSFTTAEINIRRWQVN